MRVPNPGNSISRISQALVPPRNHPIAQEELSPTLRCQFLSVSRARVSGLTLRRKGRASFRDQRVLNRRGETMKRLLVAAINTGILISGLAGCTDASGNNVEHHSTGHPGSAPKKTMRAFSSEQELAVYLKVLAEKQKQARHRMFDNYGGVAMAAKSAAPAAPSAGADKDESITNGQHAGVDEGGIGKVHGNHLVVLRRGRLFTVAIGSGALTPISSVEAFCPDIDPGAVLYDEMLVSADTIAVIGYSYERAGTEVGPFKIDPAGKLSYQSTYHWRSNDDYSSRN